MQEVSNDDLVQDSSCIEHELLSFFTGISMTIFHYVPQKRRQYDSNLAERILYWSLRWFTFLIALELGLLSISAFLWIPFYAAEGYSVQFEDRILGLLSAFLLFLSIIIPHGWTLRGAAFIFRVAMITLSVSATLGVDLIAYKRGISSSPFTATGCRALLVGTTLLVTLQLEKRRRRFSSGTFKYSCDADATQAQR